MKVLLSWLRDYVNLDSMDVNQISEALTSIGLEVEAVEAIEMIKGGLKGVVVGEVIACEHHPNADRLSLTKVNIGAEAPLSIVCGAPNVAAGQKVLVATIGAKLFPTEGEPFTIKSGKIRGEVSEGMICAEDELGLGASHDGIMVLEPSATVGTPAATYLKAETDTLFEIGLTPNRPDAMSQRGVAADLGAYLVANNLKGQFIPDLAIANSERGDNSIKISIENKEACSHYAGVVLENIKVAASPKWLIDRLESIGVRSINNVVDVTNYVLHELGQPLHAFDLAKIGGNEILVKCLPSETPFKALDGSVLKLNAEDLMICDGNNTPMCMAGVYGGFDSGVANSTTAIFLESACFSGKSVRRSSQRHQLKTDASSCFEKGTDPKGVEFALYRAVYLLMELTGATIKGKIGVVEAMPYVAPEIPLRLKKLNNLTGLSLSKDEAEAIIKALQIKIVNRSEEGWQLEGPSNKPDVTREVDVIEEILRIYGFNRVPLPERLSISINYSAKPEPFQLRNKTMQHLSAMGFNEMMALSITNDKFATQVLGLKEEQVVRVHNTANQNLDSLRASLLPGMLEAVERNQNRQNPDLRLAEFGKAYLREDADTFHEEERLGMLITGRRSPENWLNTGKDGSTFYTLKGYLSNLLTRLGIDSGVTLEEVAEHAYFDSCIRMKRGKTYLAELGILKPSLLKSFGVKNETFFAEVYWATVLEVLKTVKTKFTELSKFQNVNRDLALVIDKKISFAEIQDIAFKTDKKLLREVNLFDVFEDANKLGEGKKSYAVSFTLHNTEATLKDSEVEAIMQKLIAQFETKLQATIRK